MINKISKIIGLLAFSLMVASCDQGEDVSPILDLHKPTMTIDMASAITTAEGTEIPITFNLSAPVGEKFDLFIMLQQSSTADNLDSDVSGAYANTAFQKLITIPAFVTTYTDKIVIKEDTDLEALEHLILMVGDTRTTAVLFEPKIVDITILNRGGVLKLEFDYDHTFLIGADEYTLCDGGYDMDYYILDSNDVSITNDAATGACPEELELNVFNLADGEYTVVYDIYDDAGLSTIPHTPFSIPTTVNYSRIGAIPAGTFVQEDAFAPMSTDGSGTGYVVTIVVADGVATLKNSGGDVIASGKSASIKAAIAKLRKNRK